MARRRTCAGVIEVAGWLIVVWDGVVGMVVVCG